MELSSTAGLASVESAELNSSRRQARRVKFRLHRTMSCGKWRGSLKDRGQFSLCGHSTSSRCRCVHIQGNAAPIEAPAILVELWHEVPAGGLLVASLAGNLVFASITDEEHPQSQ